MAPWTGQRSEHTVQNEPLWARQCMGWIHATPIFSGRSLRRTPGSHAEMHGVSAHMMQAFVCASIIGVPAASRNRPGARMIASTGQTSTHWPQRVHPARNSRSGTAPGGRCTGSGTRRAPGAGRACAPATSSTRSAMRSARALRIPPRNRPRSRSRREMGLGSSTDLDSKGTGFRTRGTAGRGARWAHDTGRSSGGRDGPAAAPDSRRYRGNSRSWCA